jgi:hypothetical protein
MFGITSRPDNISHAKGEMGSVGEVQKEINLPSVWCEEAFSKELVEGIGKELPQGTNDELTEELKTKFADAASMIQSVNDTHSAVESQFIASISDGDLLAGYALLLLIMQISLQDAERQHDRREQLLPMVCDISITVLALAKKAIEESYIGNILQSMQNIIRGGVDVIDNNTSRESGDKRICTILEQSAMAQEVSANLLNAIADTAKNYTEQTSQEVDMSLQQGEADLKKISQEMQRIIENGNRYAQMIMDATLPVLTRK